MRHYAASVGIDNGLHSPAGVPGLGMNTGRELAVTIPDQEPRPAPGILQIHDQVPRGLGYPGGGGMRRRTQDADAASGVLDDPRLPLQDRDLVTQRKDLRVFVPVAHWQQPQ